MVPASATTRPVEQLPEPARFWIAHAPRSWHSAGGLWTDLANARVSGFRGTRGAPLPELDAAALDDLFYLPPVVPELAARRDELAAELALAHTPVLLELHPGERTAADGAHVVYDLLPSLVAGDLDRLAELPRGSTAAWPLIGGLTDLPEVWNEAFARLAAAGVDCVQAVRVELEPTVRRRLAEGRGDEVFDTLFHGEPATEREFAAHARRYALAPFMRRPTTGATPRRIRNRRFAASLALAGEVWLRLGKPMSVGQSLFRAARGAEQTHRDLKALVEENNLSVMNWVDAHSLEVVEEIVRTGSARLLEELMAEYLGGE